MPCLTSPRIITPTIDPPAINIPLALYHFLNGILVARRGTTIEPPAWEGWHGWHDTTLLPLDLTEVLTYYLPT